MRIEPGIVQRIRHPLLEILRNDVLELLGFRMDLIPGDAQGFGQVELNQAMVTHDLEMAGRTAGRIVRMHYGRIAEKETAS